MKQHDSIKQAEAKLAKALKLLAKWRLPATPINYAIVYEYLSGKNLPLITKLDQHLFSHDTIDNFTLEEIFQQHVLGQSSLRDNLFEDVESVTGQVKDACIKSSVHSQQFVDAIDKSISTLSSASDGQEQALTALKYSTERFKTQQQKFAEALLLSQQKANALQRELAEARKEIYLDPITNLYNKKALSKHFDAWISESPEKQIAAVVINVDHFQDFSEKFGSLIGDVILSKIANKISNYVGESGLPVRTGNEEFFILLPEVEKSIASEIAEKIRQGVEKIRFISSKSGIRLPQMTISLGVTELNPKERLESLMTRTQKALSNAQSKGRNQVATA